MKEYQLGLYEKAMPSQLTMEEKLKKAKASGFDFVELSIDESDEKLSRLDMTIEERAEVRKAMEKAGLCFKTMCLSGLRRFSFGSHNPEVRAISLKLLEKAVLLANDLGIRLIQIPGYDTYYEQSDYETARCFFDTLKQAVSIAAVYGVALGFETMETPFMDTVEKAADVVRRIDSPYLGVYPDIGNLTNAALLYHEDVKIDLERGKGIILAAHLKDTLPGIYRDITLGSGHTDFQRCALRLLKLGTRMFVGEFWFHEGDDWEPEIARACQFLRSVLDKAIVEKTQIGGMAV